MTTTWTIEQNHHASGAYEVFEYQGAPVIVAMTGRYPAATDGEQSTAECPHILISVGGYSTHDPNTGSRSEHYNSVRVLAYGRWDENGRRRTLQVFEHTQHEAANAPDGLMSIARQHLDDALFTLRDIDRQYDEAERRIFAAHDDVRAPLTRDEYEAACERHGVRALSDAECDSYGVRYGDFQYPAYSADHVVAMHLAALRLRKIDEESPRSWELHISVENPYYRPDVNGSHRGKCARCGAPDSAYIAGAGEHLCPRHQDDY